MVGRVNVPSATRTAAPPAVSRQPSRRRYVLAVDSFKGTLGAAAACAALADGIRSVDPEARIVERPMADGGEGTIEAFARAAAGAQRVPVTVIGPDDLPVTAHWLRVPGTPGDPTTLGVVELANTSGIELLAGSGLRPITAHTFGFGQAIRHAIESGVERLVLCLGSSASSDGGSGALRALGAEVRSADGDPVDLGVGGLETATTVAMGDAVAAPPGGVLLVTDVRAPLLGADGAARVFGPQKGADQAEVERIERALHRWSQLVGADPQQPGTGAAGGTGYALKAWGADLVEGAHAIADLLGLDAALRDADLVVTGEGAYDAQSALGKVPAIVAARAARFGIPVALVAGRIGPTENVFDASLSLTDLAGAPEPAMSEPERWLRVAGQRIAAQHTVIAAG